jgi:hypothetical protein
LDLKKSSREYLKKTFFGGKSGDVKVRFAKALVAAPATPSKAAAPEWATHIADFFKKGKFTGGQVPTEYASARVKATVLKSS